MSRRARACELVGEATRDRISSGSEDDIDDEGGIDAKRLACDGTGLDCDTTTCAACGDRSASDLAHG